jgi:putative transposase
MAALTSLKFIEELKASGIAISMDGKGAWRDNAFIERFWKTLIAPKKPLETG